MSAITGSRAAGLVIAVVIAVLAAGCGGTSSTSSTPSRSPSSSAAASAVALTAADLAWIQAITELHNKIDKPFRASSINMTRAKMIGLGHSLRTCRRKLNRIGVPSPRLQPVYELVKKACDAYAKGARCFARAASVSDAAGAVIAGTREDRIQRRADACGFAAQGNGGNLMSEAEAKAAEIRARFR